MPLLSAINASASGLDAQRARMEVAASISRTPTRRTARTMAYTRREVVLQATDPDGFGATLNRVEASGVKVGDIVEDQSAFGRRYEPSTPTRMPMASSPRRTSTCRRR